MTEDSEHSEFESVYFVRPTKNAIDKDASGPVEKVIALVLYGIGEGCHHDGKGKF
jgi:hypothetical protein